MPLKQTLSNVTTFQNDLYFAADFQNYLRTQTGSTTTINIIICTVDYLLRLQVLLESNLAQRVKLMKIKTKILKGHIGDYFVTNTTFITGCAIEFVAV